MTLWILKNFAYQGVWVSIDPEVSPHVKIPIAITQKPFARELVKYTSFKMFLHWPSKNVKIIFIGTMSQKLDGLKHEICRDTCIIA